MLVFYFFIKEENDRKKDNAPFGMTYSITVIPSDYPVIPSEARHLTIECDHDANIEV